MKWLIIVLVVVFAGWQAAVFLVTKNSSNGQQLLAADTLQAKMPPAENKALAPDKEVDSVKAGRTGVDTLIKNNITLPKGTVDTKAVDPQQVVAFAKSLVGIPYKYGSTNPAEGFDCSGFVTHVFSRFNIVVPRSSIDFTNVGTEISALDAKPGDLVLFTGTDVADRFVGHMGIVVSNDTTLQFIHATSGKQYGVTITPLSEYYQRRYVKTIRIFPQNRVS